MEMVDLSQAIVAGPVRLRSTASARNSRVQDYSILTAYFLVTLAFAPTLASSYHLLDASHASILSYLVRATAVVLGALACVPFDLRRVRPRDVLLVIGLLTASLQFAMAQSIEPAMEILFVNGLAAAPFFILLPLARRAVPYNRIWSILGMSVALQLVLGVALSFIGAPEGRQLDSLNDGIGGTMGTANMFAMLCLLVAVRYAFFYRRGALFVGLGVLGVSLAGSLAAVGCLCVVVSVGLAMGHRASATTTKLVLGAVLLASLYFVLMKLFGYELALSFDHVIYKAESMWRVASGEGGSELSRSIELRLAGWTDVTHGVLNDLGVALFGRLGGGRYFLADSQVVTYVGSFGLPVALMILAPMLSSVHDLLHVKNGRCAFALQALLVIVFLLVNRMFDYFTGAALAALVVSEIRARSRGAVG